MINNVEMMNEMTVNDVKALGPEVLQMCQSLMVRMLRVCSPAQRPMAVVATS